MDVNNILNKLKTYNTGSNSNIIKTNKTNKTNNTNNRNFYNQNSYNTSTIKQPLVNLSYDISKLKKINTQNQNKEIIARTKYTENKRDVEGFETMNTSSSSNNNFDSFDINELLLLFKIEEPEDKLTLSQVQDYTTKFLNDIPESHSNIKNMLIPSKDKLLEYFSNKIGNNNISADKNKDSKFIQDDNGDDNNNEEEDAIINRTILNKDTIYNNPVKEGKLNPNLENVINKTLIIDSRYRQYTYYPTSLNTLGLTTNPFTIDLEHSINDLLSFKLFSLHIPMVWDNISSVKKNNIFFITNLNSDEISENLEDPIQYMSRDINGDLFLNVDNELVCESNYLPIIIPDNKYSDIKDLVEIINESINESILFFQNNLSSKCPSKTTTLKKDDILFKYNTRTDKVELIITNGSIKFFSAHNNVNIDNSLGWTLGFRKIHYSHNPSNPDNNMFISEAKYDISDTKFIMIYIDDYLQNRINTNIEYSGDASVISSNASISKKMITDIPVAQDNVMLENFENTLKETHTNNKSNLMYLPIKPRTHTQAELYAFSQTHNSQYSTDNIFTNSRLKPPSTNNCFAIIPIKGTSSNTDKNLYPYVDFSGSLQALERKYFGPVNLRRLKITLVDDKGFNIDLKGLNWSFVIQCSVLYQY